MIKLTYNHRETYYFAKPRGRIKQASRRDAKFNRVGKLAGRWPQFEAKLIHLLETKQSQEAFACLLMARCGIRIGNEDSAEGYESKVKGFEGQIVQTYGASTLLKSHVTIFEDVITLNFVGKKVVDQSIVINDPLLAEYGELFLKLNQQTEKWLDITDDSVAKFIKKRIDRRLTIKDFRTFFANCKAYQIYEDTVKDLPPPERKADLSKELKGLITHTSEFLGNTPSICKSAYLSPHLLEWITEQRNSVVAQREELRAQKKVEREAKWKQMNAERVAKGLRRKYRKRRKSKKVVATDEAQS